jgi:anti-sigma B factor antagonist
MAASPISHVPPLSFDIETQPDRTVVRCAGRIIASTTESLKSTIKPLFAQNKIVVVDLTEVDYMDSSGLGTIVGLHVSAKSAKSQLKLINLNQRIKELFSLTRLTELLEQSQEAQTFYP